MLLSKVVSFALLKLVTFLLSCELCSQVVGVVAGTENKRMQLILVGVGEAGEHLTPQPPTLNPQPSSPTPESCTLYPKPKILDLKPPTHKPKTLTNVPLSLNAKPHLISSKPFTRQDVDAPRSHQRGHGTPDPLNLKPYALNL
jgi:hypothetical protein